ncbi:nucleoside/nucleotide kinase family protein [Flavitalea antarctica]
MNNIIIEPLSANLDASKQRHARLALIEEVLQDFHDLDIRYCHWKSNEHLAASMSGDTDLDILFDEKDKAAFKIIMSKHGFKRFTPAKEKQYRDIDDYIGLDFSSGKLIHLHTHFKLTLGESYLKGYQLNLEQKILDSRVFDVEFGIYRSAPAFELILLFFRYALKLRTRDILKSYFKKDIRYGKNVLAEYEWLKTRCTNNDIELILKSVFSDYFPIYNLVTQEFTHKILLQLSALLHKQLRDQRLYSSLEAMLRRWYREIAIKVYRKWAKYSGRPTILQRIRPEGGLVVAIIGADGSGKSTVIANLQATFRKKIDVYGLYMGRGKSGERSWQRRFLKGLKTSYTQYQQPRKSKTKEDIPSTHKQSFRYNLFKCFEALAVARERRRNLTAIRLAKAKGMLVICDRFPQNQTMGYNDGPALSYLLQSKNILLRFMARYEAKTYQLAEDNPPDLVFKLIANADVIAKRKPSNASLKMLELKIEGIKNLQYAGQCQAIAIDAHQPLNNVLVSVKRHLWSSWE